MVNGKLVVYVTYMMVYTGIYYYYLYTHVETTMVKYSCIRYCIMAFERDYLATIYILSCIDINISTWQK